MVVLDTIPTSRTGNQRAIAVRHWNRIRNNGDALSAIIIQKLFNGAPFLGPAAQPHLLGVGSILFMVTPQSTIWGSGVLNKIAHLPTILPKQVRALRGKLSADFLMEKGVSLGDIAFGDPGIFVHELLQERFLSGPSRYRVAVVPHHDSANDPFFDKARQRDDVCIVDMLDDSLKPIEQIAQSEIVLSQSLHGLVYAESLGKRSLWISGRSDEIWNFKFEDWFTTTANPQRKPAMIDRSLESLIADAELRYCNIQKEDLRNCFPSDLFTSETRGMMDYQDCRSLSPFLFFFPKEHELEGIFEPVRDMPVLTSISSELRSILSNLYRNWAERPYSVAALIGADAIPTPPQSNAIMAALDQRSYVDYAFIIKKPNSLPPEASEIALAHGVCLYRGFKALGSVLFLRPSFETLSDNFVVFGI